MKNLWLSCTCFVGEGIRDDEGVAVVCRREAGKLGDVYRARGAGLVLEALVVRPDLVAVEAHLDLGGEGDVGAGMGRQCCFERREQQQAQCWIRPQPRADGFVDDQTPRAVLTVTRGRCCQSVRTNVTQLPDGRAFEGHVAEYELADVVEGALLEEGGGCSGCSRSWSLLARVSVWAVDYGKASIRGGTAGWCRAPNWLALE